MMARAVTAHAHSRAKKKITSFTAKGRLERLTTSVVDSTKLRDASAQDCRHGEGAVHISPPPARTVVVLECSSQREEGKHQHLKGTSTLTKNEHIAVQGRLICCQPKRSESDSVTRSDALGGLAHAGRTTHSVNTPLAT